MALFGAAPVPPATTTAATSTSYKHQLRCALSGLASPDLAATSVAAARAVLRDLRSGHHSARGALKAALQEVLTGTDGAPKHAARLRLQLAEFAVLECFVQADLAALLPLLTKQANAVLAAHRSDAAAINSLAALLSSCLARLLHDPRGSYAAMHARETRSGGSSSPDGEPTLPTPTADQLCEALLFPVIKATFRDPEQMRVSAGSIVLCGMFEVLRAHTRDQPAALDCVQRGLALMLQLMGHSSGAQRAPGVLLPVCTCVEVLGLGLDKECTSRLLSLCLKAAVVKEPWQVRRDACQTLAVLATALVFRAPPPPTPDGASSGSTQPGLVLTPAVEALVERKPQVMQLLEEVRYDRIAAVRAGAAAAWAEFGALPDPPPELAPPDASPSASPDKAAGSRRGGKQGSKLAGAARSSVHSRSRSPPPRFVRPQQQPGQQLDFGIQVFAPPHPLPLPPACPSQEPAAGSAGLPQEEGGDTSPSHAADQSLRQSVDAAAQTAVEGVEGHHTYTVQSPGASSAAGWPADLQPQQPGLSALLAAAGSGSPMRFDVSHHVHGRVELGITYSVQGSPVAAGPGQPVSLDPAGSSAPGSPAAAAVAAALGAAVMGVSAGSVVEQPAWFVNTGQQPPQEVQQQAHQQQQQQRVSSSSGGMACEASFAVPSLDVPAAVPGVSGAAGAAGTDDGRFLHVVLPAECEGAAAEDGCSAPGSAEHLASLSRQRQRWQLPASSNASVCEGGSPRSSVRAVGAAGSEQGTPRSEHSPLPRSPSSLDVLRSVGERVQHLLESLTRQNSGTSRNTRTPSAGSEIGAGHGTPAAAAQDDALSSHATGGGSGGAWLPAAAPQAVSSDASGALLQVQQQQLAQAAAQHQQEPGEPDRQAGSVGLHSSLQQAAEPMCQAGEGGQLEQQQQPVEHGSGMLEGMQQQQPEAVHQPEEASAQAEALPAVLLQQAATPQPGEAASAAAVQPAPASPQQPSLKAAKDASSPPSSQGRQPGAAAVDTSSTAAACGTLPAAAPSLVTAPPADGGGLSQVDRALEKLQSLRSALNQSSSSSGSSTAPAETGSLASRAASLQLPSPREHSSGGSSGGPLQPSPATGAGSAAAAAAPQQPERPQLAGAASLDEAGAGLQGDVLASAKDWLKDISERLQQAGTAATEASDPLLPAPQATAAGVPDAVAATPAAGGDAPAGVAHSEGAVAAAVSCSAPSAVVPPRLQQLLSSTASSPQGSWTSQASTPPPQQQQQPQSDCTEHAASPGLCGLLVPGLADAAAPGSPAVEQRRQPDAASPDAQPMQLVQQDAQQQLVVPGSSTEQLDALAAPAAGAADRLQQMLAAGDDTLLLMSFALKLERLGTRQPALSALPMLAAAARHAGGRVSPASPGGSTCWQVPSNPCSPPRGAGATTWSITHNALYAASSAAASPVATPRRAPAAASGSPAIVDASPTSYSSPAATAAQGQLRSGCEEPDVQLFDAVLCSVLGVGLTQLQDQDDEAVAAVVGATNQLQAEVLQAATQHGIHRADAAGQVERSPALVLLMQELRQELRQHCMSRAACDAAAASPAGGSRAGGSRGVVDACAAAAELQEAWFAVACLPLLQAALQRAALAC